MFMEREQCADDCQTFLLRKCLECLIFLLAGSIAAGNSTALVAVSKGKKYQSNFADGSFITMNDSDTFSEDAFHDLATSFLGIYNRRFLPNDLNNFMSGTACASCPGIIPVHLYISESCSRLTQPSILKRRPQAPSELFLKDIRSNHVNVMGVSIF